jgi:hypothetical protein
MFKDLDFIDIHLEKKFEKAKIDSNLAKHFYPIFVNDCNVSMLHASLNSKDGTYTLSSFDESTPHSLFGEMKIQNIFKSLEKVKKCCFDSLAWI